MRRGFGIWLDSANPAVRESDHHIVLSEEGFALKGYARKKDSGPALLLVPAPLKAAYIWDIIPRASVVRRCLAAGFGVFLVEWRAPGSNGQRPALADYADRFLDRCLQAIRNETGQERAFVAGHSLGGTFAAIFAALHPERIQALVLLGAPLNFGAEIGAFGPMVAATAPIEKPVELPGDIPGSFLNSISMLASPETFAWSRALDLLQSLPDSAALETYFAVERWTLDERPLARRLFQELREQLFRRNRFMRGTLVLAGKRSSPEQVTSPLLAVVDARCPITPPAAVLPFVRAVRSSEKQVLWYEGDVGVSLQHVGMLVGKNAHQRLWPRILEWLRAHAT